MVHAHAQAQHASPIRAVPEAVRATLQHGAAPAGRHAARGNQATLRLLAAPSSCVQPKLSAGAPGDAFEQEADRVADHVMRMPDPSLRRQEDDDEEELQTIRTSGVDGAAASLTPEVADGVAGLRGLGQPLPQSARAFFEPRFGRDFGDVRVHTNHAAADLAQSLHARAFTHGRDVAFGEGQYAPNTPEGGRLLAHELTHVVQQSGGGADSVSRASRTGEEDEEEIGTRAPGPDGLVQCDWALEPPRPRAAGRRLSAVEMQAAIDYNNRVLIPAGDAVIREVRDVLGVDPDPAVVDADLTNAIVYWQAVQGLTQDGQLGPRTAGPLFREFAAEGAGHGSLRSGPTYTPNGVIPCTVSGRRKTAHFDMAAAFETNPAMQIFPSCCEVRQYISWDATAGAAFGPTGVPHRGFPAGSPAVAWYEDRDWFNKRYGHRGDRFSDPQTFDQYVDGTGQRNQAFGDTYTGSDDPGGPARRLQGQWDFMLQVVDVANNEAVLGTEDFVTVTW